MIATRALSPVARALEYAGTHSAADIAEGVASGRLLPTFPRVPSSRIPTDATTPRRPTIRELADNRILRGEGMTTDAMGLPSLLGIETDSSQDIFPHRNWFKVGWIHTGGVSTEVVNRKSLGDRFHQMLIDKSMGISKHTSTLTATNINIAIAPSVTGIFEFWPRPTFCIATASLC